MVKTMAMYKNAGKKTMKAKKEFTPCSRCPNPRACTSAGMCLAKAMS
jgi:hypothetical protein